MDVDLKRCSKCGIVSSLMSNFHARSKSSDGLTSHCKLCPKNYRKNVIVNIMI